MLLIQSISLQHILSKLLSPLALSLLQMDDEAMASMLADFVDCPPDDDDHGASQSQS